MDLFESNRQKNAPLADRMRSNCLDDFLGQSHIVGQGSLLRRAIIADRLGSCIFYGPPGCGKSTLANIISMTTNSCYVQLNAVSSGVADAKKVIQDAKDNLAMYGRKTYLLLDECHRWNKAQSDSMLSAIEKGEIIFIGSTTENPFFNMTKAIISRCRVFEFQPLSDEDILLGLKRALNDKKDGLAKYLIEISDDALLHFMYASNGDLRVALNALELAVLTTPPKSCGTIVITKKIASQSIQTPPLSIDTTTYYDMISAFCKSMRGSDADASLYYALRLINAGCDPMLIARRVVIHASEDVGLSDPQALVVATNAMYAYEKIGLPEGRIPLCQAIIYVCNAPKSNSVVKALNLADKIAKDAHDNVPMHLKNIATNSEYKYPHDYGGYVKQQYLPDSIKDLVFYTPSQNGQEKGMQIKKNKKGELIYVRQT